MSRAQLAEAAEVPPISITNYERGRNRPREDTLDRIMEALSLPLDALDRAEDFARHPAASATEPCRPTIEVSSEELPSGSHRSAVARSRTSSLRPWSYKPAGGRSRPAPQHRLPAGLGQVARPGGGAPAPPP